MWDLLIIQPLVNAMLLLYQLLGNNLTLTIIALTVLIRLITFPLTWQSQVSQKKMQQLQQSDEWKAIQKKYADNREALAQEQMKLWQREGINPFGGCLPMLIQLPILIGLYQAITTAIAASPAQLLSLSTNLYGFLPNVERLIPLDNRFLWMNLGLPDPYFVMPLLVVVTSFLQSKVMTPPATDAQAAQMSQTMMLTTTLMFGYFSFTFASGLSVYFVVSNILGVLQYGLTNPIDWRKLFTLNLKPAIAVPATPEKPKDKPRKKK
jgi:YidC/Oxa1 family membrane protein insertase